MGKVVQLEQVPPLLLRRGERLAELQLMLAPALRVHGEEFVAEHRLERRRRLVPKNRGLHDFEDAQLVGDARALGDAQEFVQLAQAPLGLDVAGRQDRHEDSHLRQPIDELVREDIVALQLRNPARSSAAFKQLTQPDLQRAMERGNPAGLSLGEHLIVDVRVGVEDVVLEFRRRR